MHIYKPRPGSYNNSHSQWSTLHRADYVIHLQRSPHATNKTFNQPENYSYQVVYDGTERAMSEQWWKVCRSQRVSKWWAGVTRSSLHCHYCVHALCSTHTDTHAHTHTHTTHTQLQDRQMHPYKNRQKLSVWGKCAHVKRATLVHVIQRLVAPAAVQQSCAFLCS